MGKIRVLHVIDKLEIGGAQTFFRDLMKHQNLFNDIKFVFCSLIRSEIEVDLNKEKVLRVSGWKYNPLLILKMYLIAKRNEIEILHLHLDKSIIIGVVVSLFGNWKVVVHQHSILKFPYRVFLKILKNRINVFIAVSDAIKKELVEKALIPPNKIRVILNYIDLSLFKTCEDRNLIRFNLGIKSEEIVLGFVGRLVERKGCSYLINAVKNLPKIDSPIVLLIVGDGDLRKILIEMSHNLGEKRRSIFLGYRKDVNKLVKAFDIAILPSMIEAFPIVALEYFAMKRPVIASNVGGLPELIKDKNNGILVEKGSVNELKNAISSLIDNKKMRKSLAINGYKTVKEFDIHKILPHYGKLYKELLLK